MSYDLFDIAQSPNTTVFYSRNNGQVWYKPDNATMVFIFAVGGGGGGGNGGAGGVTVGLGGGGGGGGGAVSRLIIPAIFLPNALEVFVGSGGGPSDDGERSAVIIGDDVFANRFIVATGGTQGADGTTTFGNFGPGGVVSTTSIQIYGNLGIFTSLAGGAGTNGTIIGTAANVTTTSNITSGGAGGAGRNSAASTGIPGGVTGNLTILPTLIAGDRTLTLDGTGGIYSTSPFQSYGGVGAYGGVRTAGVVGGVGGYGAYGSGGGGGGSSTSPAVGGRGGRGGDGFIIISWI